MSTRFIRKESGTSKLLDRSTDAGIQYDTADGNLKYNDAGTVCTLRSDKGQAFAGIPLAAATLALAPATHAGRSVYVTKTDGTTITLPAATGSGAKYRVVQTAKVASSATVIQAASAADYFRGAQYAATDNGSGAGLTWPTANTGTPSSESDTLTWNGGSKGGDIGDVVEFEDIAAAVWLVKALVNESGTEGTPFSAAV